MWYECVFMYYIYVYRHQNPSDRPNFSVVVDELIEIGNELTAQDATKVCIFMCDIYMICMIWDVM